MQKSWRRKVAEWLLEFVDEFGLPNDIGKFRPLVIFPSPFVPVPCARGESAFSLPFGGLFFSFFFLFFFNENCSESPRQRSLPLVPPSLADPPPVASRHHVALFLHLHKRFTLLLCARGPVPASSLLPSQTASRAKIFENVHKSVHQSTYPLRARGLFFFIKPY